MKAYIKRHILTGTSLCLLYVFFPHISFSQYILNGAAVQNSCNCYTLTQEVNTQSGSVWNSNKINLNQPFDYWFNVFLGCKNDNGADGMVFMLQPLSTSIGTTGEGMGFEGITPSVGISLDTWQNTNRNDPAYDHINIQVNGIVTHGTDLAGPVPMSIVSDDVEDCNWHVLRIAWNPVTKTLTSWFDDIQRVQAVVDLVATVFNNDPLVYWGFTAATGGSNNIQKFCTALNPGFSTNLPNNITCINQPVIFQNSSQSFGPIQNYYWDFGDGTTSTSQNPPPHNFPQPGNYEIKMVVTALDGCRSDTLKKNVVIGSKPVAGFKIFDTCFLQPIRIKDQSTTLVGSVNKWTWSVNGVFASSSQQPQFTGLIPGNYEIKLAVESVYGCKSDTVTGFVNINPRPVIAANFPDGCMNTLVQFNANQIDNSTTITQWNWNFNDGGKSGLQNPTHNFTTSGNQTINSWAIAGNGCSSDTITDNINIVFAKADAGRDTVIIQNIPFLMQGSGGLNYSWAPSTGLNNPSISNPIALPQDDITYVLTVITAEGCIAADAINVTVFKGSAIYVPTAFTPNNDRLNDELKPTYYGIKTLDYFIVYNRWGEKVFETKEMSKGWDAKINGVNQASGTFVWVVQATDYVGQMLKQKGAVAIIR